MTEKKGEFKIRPDSTSFKNLQDVNITTVAFSASVCLSSSLLLHVNLCTLWPARLVPPLNAAMSVTPNPKL